MPESSRSMHYSWMEVRVDLLRQMWLCPLCRHQRSFPWLQFWKRRSHHLHVNRVTLPFQSSLSPSAKCVCAYSVNTGRMITISLRFLSRLSSRSSHVSLITRTFSCVLRFSGWICILEINGKWGKPGHLAMCILHGVVSHHSLALSLTKDSQLHSKGLEMMHLLLDEPYDLCKGASQPSSICDLPWDTCLELFRRS